jgi:hypothetical protein
VRELAEQVEEYAWFLNNQEEVAKYRGKHIAIVGNKIVAHGKSVKQVYDTAKRKYPDKTPLLHYVHKGELFVL